MQLVNDAGVEGMLQANAESAVTGTSPWGVGKALKEAASQPWVAFILRAFRELLEMIESDWGAALSGI